MENNTFFFKQKIETENLLNGDIKGVAYSGSVIPNYMWYKNFVVDLSTLTIAKEKTPLLRDHDHSKVAGIGKVTNDKSQLLIDGKVSKKTQFGKEIIDLAEDGFDWEMSIGVADGTVEEVEDVEVNGIHVKHGFVLRNGLLREVSVVALGADKNTNSKILNERGDIKPMLTKDQWIAFACGCGGTKETTPEQLQETIKSQKLMTEAEKAKVDELTAEVEKLKADIAAKEAEIAKIKEDEEASEREEEIEAALKEKGLEFSSEKIKESAKTKQSADMFLSFIKEMKAQDKKIGAEFSGNVIVSKTNTSKRNPEDLRLSAEQMVRDGKASNFIEAIDLLEGN